MTNTALADATALILPTIRAAIDKPSTPVPDHLANQVAVAVTKEVAPIIVNQTNNEPWYQSRVIIGSVIAVLAGLLATIFGLTIDEASQAEIVDLTMKIVTIVTQVIAIAGALFALWGRIVSKKPLGN